MVGHLIGPCRYLSIILAHVAFVHLIATFPAEAFLLMPQCSQPRPSSMVGAIGRSRLVRNSHDNHDSVIYSRDNSTTITTSSSAEKTKWNERRIARRWNGNYKHSSSKLCDVAKAKKLELALTVQHADGTTTTKTLVKKRQETLQHVLTKAILWKLCCDHYPNIEIERDIGDPDYLPDVISLDSSGDGSPLFWGESGRMKVHKAMALMRRYPNCHIVHCRWGMDIDEISAPLLDHLQELVDNDNLGDLATRAGQFTFCSIPLDVWRFIDEESGVIHVKPDDITWLPLAFPTKSSG